MHRQIYFFWSFQSAFYFILYVYVNVQNTFNGILFWMSYDFVTFYESSILSLFFLFLVVIIPQLCIILLRYYYSHQTKYIENSKYSNLCFMHTNDSYFFIFQSISSTKVPRNVLYLSIFIYLVISFFKYFFIRLSTK